MPTIAGVTMSKAKEAEFIKAALEAAEERGYCDEAENVLRDMGFDVPENEVEIIVRATVRAPRGVDNYDIRANFEFLSRYDEEYTVLDYDVEIP